MKRNTCPIFPTLLLGALLTVPVAAQKSQGDFFGLDRIWDIHITVEKNTWVGLFPDRSRSSTRLFGKFPYGKADVTIGEHSFEGVGLRMKGNATFAATGGTLKRSLKLDFNRFDPAGRFLGMGKLNLQCNALDGTQIKEAVSYSIYHGCGVAAGRTAFARVFLTIRGELERAYIGLYTAVEPVDQRFCKRVLGSGGLILKPDGETLAWHGPKWNDDWEAAYHAKSEVTDELARPLIETAALLDEPDDALVAEKLESVMDVESFLAYTAVTALLVNTDSPLTVPDNYYLIVPENTRKVTWIPWDMNWSLGGYGHVTRTPVTDLSIMRPTLKEVFRRILEIPRFRKRYRELAARYVAGPGSAKAMITAIHRAHATVKEALAQEAKRDEKVTNAPAELGGRGPMRHRMLEPRAGDDVKGLEAFARARERSILEQLAGKAEGRSAPNLWGPNDRIVRGAPIRDALTGTPAFDPAVEAWDAKALEGAVAAAFPKLDTDGSKTLDAKELAEALRRRFGRSSRRRPPHADLARRAIELIDADADGALTTEEWTKGIAGLRRFWDRDLDRSWSRKELNVAGR